MPLPRRATLAKYAWLAALSFATAFLLWLWLAAHTDHPKRLFHSTDRYCSYIGFENGRFQFSYDGGDDVRTFKQRKFSLLGVFYDAHPGMGKWQYCTAGIHGVYACVWLGPMWLITFWFAAARPIIRKRRGWCLKCGYDLKGVRDPRCPECGSPTVPTLCAI